MSKLPAAVALGKRRWVGWTMEDLSKTMRELATADQAGMRKRLEKARKAKAAKRAKTSLLTLSTAR